MCDTLKVMYGVRRILRGFLRFMSAYLSSNREIDLYLNYGEFKGLIDELEMQQPIVTDATTLRRYRQDIAVSEFLSSLSPSLRP